MKTAIPLGIKIRDIVKGFFGWLIFGNLVFGLPSLGLGLLVKYKDYEIFLSILSLLVWVSTIITCLILYFKKNTGTLTGVLLAFVINGVSMNAQNLVHTSLGKVLLLMGFPFPACVIPYMLIGQ